MARLLLRSILTPTGRLFLIPWDGDRALCVLQSCVSFTIAVLLYSNSVGSLF